MWANRNPASHDLGRIMRTRVSKTVARNHVAAIRGSSYYAYDQDPLQEEVKATAGLMDRLTGPDVGEWKKGGLFGSAGEHSDFYDEKHDKIEGLEENQTHAIAHIQDMMNIRTQMMATYHEALHKAISARKTRDSLQSDTHLNMGKFIKYANVNIGNKDAIHNMTGESYAEIKKKYDSVQLQITHEQKIIEDNETLMSELEEKIVKQDNDIRESADIAGLDLPSTIGSFTDSIASSVPPFAVGMIAAVGISILLASRRGRTSPAKGRRGSAYDVFMGR